MPRRKPPKSIRKEGSIENSFLVKMREYRPEADCWKQNGRGHAARPDRQVILPMLTCWIEFKRPGEFPTAAQQRELDSLEAKNHMVAACDTVRQAILFVEDCETDIRKPWRRRWEDDHDV